MEKEINRENLKEYNIYAGLGGGFGGATYQYTSMFENSDQAEEEARLRAEEEYDNYDGLHGLRTIQDIIDEDYDTIDISENEYDEVFADAEQEYLEERESWLDYWATLTTEDTETEPEDLIRDYTIDDDNDSDEISCD